MELNRWGEQSHTPFRSRRLYMANGQWHFDTREGKTFGPYRVEFEAKKALAVFIAQIYCSQNLSKPDNIDVHYGVQDGIEHMIEELVPFFHVRNDFGQTTAMAWAHRRLMELTDSRVICSNNKERKEAIEYALDQE